MLGMLASAKELILLKVHFYGFKYCINLKSVTNNYLNICWQVQMLMEGMSVSNKVTLLKVRFGSGWTWTLLHSSDAFEV